MALLEERWFERSRLALFSNQLFTLKLCCETTECVFAPSLNKPLTLSTSELLFIYISATHSLLPLGIPPYSQLLSPPTFSVMTHFRSFHTSTPEWSPRNCWHGNRTVIFGREEAEHENAPLLCGLWKWRITVTVKYLQEVIRAGWFVVKVHDIEKWVNKVILFPRSLWTFCSGCLDLKETPLHTEGDFQTWYLVYKWYLI